MTTPNSDSDWQMPLTERRSLLAIIWIGCILYSCGSVLADPDVWGHTYYGVRVIEQGRLVEPSDPFSFTAPGSRWINHEWLSEYEFGWLWLHAGSLGLWMWRNAMVLGIFSIALVAGRSAQISVAAAAALWILNAECLTEFLIFVRPQLATFVLYGATLAVLRYQWDHQATRWIWGLPFVMCLWTNQHGGFLAGIAIHGVFALGHILRDRIANRLSGRSFICLGVLLFSILATFVNPYGATLHAMLWDHLVPTQLVREWQPIWAAQQSPVHYTPYFLILLAIPFSRRWKWIDLAILAVVVFQSVSHIRHVALLSVTTLVLLPGPLTDSLNRLFRHVSRQWSGTESRGLRLAAVCSLSIFLVGLQIREFIPLSQQGLFIWDLAVETRADVPGMPVRAVRFMKQQRLRGNLVTDYGWGQYVIWHLFPESRVAFDGRYRTIYPADVERDLVAFHQAKPDQQGPTPLLDDYPAELILLSKSRCPHGYLTARDDWSVVYEDDQAILLVRDLPQFRDRIPELLQAWSESASERLRRWEAFPAGPRQRKWRPGHEMIKPHVTSAAALR